MVDKKIDTKKKPYVTGFCNSGACEGTKKMSERGSLLRACSGEYVIQGKSYSCGCDCHEVFRQIAELTGISVKHDLISTFMGPASLKENAAPIDVPKPKEAPVVGLLPSSFAAPVVDTAGVPSLPDVAPRPTASGVPAPKMTPTGRAAKGELEGQVKYVLRQHFALAEMGTAPALSPKEICEIINKAKPPSSGAVYAVLQRLKTKGIIALADKPFRVLDITEYGRRASW